ncbi:MAG: hypothetical protein M1834_000629 [Cirrosporium novae-zelandiae]|nr:MAG: hypothetical protein M1834_000629 [Cirrosporium novae-zelandiae]
MRHTPASKEDPAVIPKSPRKIRKGWYLIGGTAIYCFTAYGVYLYYSYHRAVDQSRQLSLPDDVSNRYDWTATSYDADIEFSEKLMGMKKLRKKLVAKSKGHVLEVSCGTGRNVEFYAPGIESGEIKSLTFVDRSGPMMEVAQEKFKGRFPGFVRVGYRVQAAEELKTAPEFEGFDTVVETMGLCSVVDPVGFLKHLGSLVKEDGQILLLEHGRSFYESVSRILDDLAKQHANRHGCWWNRDIDAIVEASGLEVVKVRRKHLGTTYWLELRRKKDDGGGTPVES